MKIGTSMRMYFSRCGCCCWKASSWQCSVYGCLPAGAQWIMLSKEKWIIHKQFNSVAQCHAIAHSVRTHTLQVNVARNKFHKLIWFNTSFVAPSNWNVLKWNSNGKQIPFSFRFLFLFNSHFAGFTWTSAVVIAVWSATNNSKILFLDSAVLGVRAIPISSKA